MWRIWKWMGIIAPCMVVVSALLFRNGLSNLISDSASKPLVMVLSIFELLAGVLGVVALYAVPIINVIFITKRTATEMFSDKGYLTFTLPVKRETLLASKLITAVIFEYIASALEFILIAIFFVIGIPTVNDDLLMVIFEAIPGLIKMLVEDSTIVSYLLTLEVSIIFDLMMIFTTVFLHYCVIKARGFGGLGIFIGITMGATFVSSFLISLSSGGIAVLMSGVNDGRYSVIIRLAGLALIFAIISLTILLYHKAVYKLEYELNLN